MKKIWVSGLMNVETTVKIGEFPIEYAPVEYSFFGVKSSVSGVGVNVVGALKKLGDEVVFASLIGKDDEGDRIIKHMEEAGVDTSLIKRSLDETPTSIIMYDDSGKRKIICDLKNIQDMQYPVKKVDLEKEMKQCDIAVICNINFNRDILKSAKNAGVLIATDVHVLEQVQDEYNRDFMRYADILFLSDEKIKNREEEFLRSLADEYPNLKVIVLGRGSLGASMYLRDSDEIVFRPAVKNPAVVNTVGAGDALFSSFLHYYAKGLDPVSCLDKAQAFASYKIGFNGGAAGFATEEEVEAYGVS